MNYSNIKNCNQRQFNFTMKRECISVTDYYDTNKTYDVFFRRNNRGTNPQGKLRFYYSQDTDIAIGTIFILKDIPYLVISQDGIESDVYYTSIAVRCDTEFYVYSNSKKSYVTVPCAVISDKYTLTNNSTISLISGSVTVYTGDYPDAREMSINSNYYAFGGYYTVGNVFYNNGLAYIYMTREAKPADSYTLIYNGVTSLDMTDSTTYQLTYTAVMNGSVVNNPTLTYASSNEEVATVSEEGLLTLLKSGSITITATWTDGDNTTCSTVITVTDSSVEPVPDVGALTISGNTSLKVGFSRTYTALYTDAEGNDVSSDYTSVWTITDAAFDTSKITQTVSGNTIKLLVEDEELIDETFKLNVVDSDNTYESVSVEITLVEGF